MTYAPRPVLRRLNAGKPSRSPEGTAMLAGLTGKHIARRAGLGAARRSARDGTPFHPLRVVLSTMDN